MNPRKRKLLKMRAAAPATVPAPAVEEPVAERAEETEMREERKAAKAPVHRSSKKSKAKKASS